MQPKRKQGPGQVRRPQKPVSPVFKTGDYVPLAILIVEGDKLKNYHLPQKLYAAKDFTQADVMLEYFFQHPQQPLMLDPNRPRPAEFNGAVCNFSNWMVERGYCTREDGVSDLKIHIWTPEEINADRAAKAAARQLQIEQHAEYMAARVAEGGDEGMEISQGINNLLGVSEQLMADGTKLFAEGSMDKLQNDVQVNVGTVGHVDHGVTQVVHALERAADDYGQAALAGVAIEIDPADPDPASTRAFIEQELVSQRSLTPDPVAYERQAGASADLPEAYLLQERSAHELDSLLVDPAPVERPRREPHYCGTNDPSVLTEEVRTPQYPLVEKSDLRLVDVDNRVISDAELLTADPKGGL
jgi:hypothetical protein